MLKWKAYYNDGTFLNQFSEDGSENRYKDINRSKLSSFSLYDGQKAVFILFLHEGQRLIFRRRTTINLNNVVKDLVYLVGYHQTIEGKNYSVISYIRENGLVELDNCRKDLVVLPEEQ
jgi:hypothetical protein